MTAASGARPRRVSYAEAADILATRDPVLAGLIAAGGPIQIGRRTATPFAALSRRSSTSSSPALPRGPSMVVGSPRSTTTCSPRRCWRSRTTRPSAVGLSTNKVRSLRDLATKVQDGTVAPVAARPLPASRTRRSSPASRPFAASDLDGPDVSDVPAQAPRRLAGRRPRGPPSLRSRVEVSRRRPRASSNRSVSPTAHTGRSWPGTAGGPPSSTQAPVEAHSPAR